MKFNMQKMESKKKIDLLLIEDDEDLRNSLSLYFQTRGYINLIKVENAEIALEVLNQNEFDIIICDFWLPGISGMDFFKQISGYISESIKILISAYAIDDISEDIKNAGIHALIKKPFTGEEIENSINDILNN